jgi:hypothetical protein
MKFNRFRFTLWATNTAFARWLKRRLHIISPSEYVLTGKSNGWIACGRCLRPIRESKAETCWYCTGWLCVECWDKFGHCGHPEADAANEYARNRKPGDPLLPMPSIENPGTFAVKDKGV